MEKKSPNKITSSDTDPPGMAITSESGDLFPMASTLADGAGHGVRENQARGEHDHAATLDAPPVDAGEDAAFQPRDISDQLVKSKVRSALFQKPRQPLKISRFVLLERIGTGGMGEIYAAYDSQLERKVAIKLLRPEMRTANARARQRLLREAQTLARVSHPNVVHVYEAGETGDQVYLAMELVLGVPLNRWLEQFDADRERRWQVILDKLVAAGRGLAAIHDAGLLHRDFKPANVLVRPDGRVCVVDLGLARSAAGTSEATVTAVDRHASVAGEPDDPPDGARTSFDDRLTMTGMLVGTPAYMAPEQITGGVADHRSDQFSFCVALYEALYGARPFRGQDFTTLRDSVTSGEIMAPPARSRVPGWLWKVLARGLANQPGDRYPSMAVLLAALERVSARKRQRWVAAAALLCGGVVAGSAAVLGVLEDRGEECAAAAGMGLTDTWNPWIKERIRAAFSVTRAPYAEAVWQSIERGIDQYQQRWQHERVAACRATHVDEIQTHDELVLRNRCLDQQAGRLRVLVDQLVDADARLVENALSGVTFLGTPETCSNLQALAPAPLASTLQPAVQAMRVGFDQAHVQAIAGDFDRALQLTEKQLAVAVAMDHQPVLAEALYHHGAIRLERGTDTDVEEGTEAMLRALDLAEAAGDDALTAEIWNTLVRHREGNLAAGQLAFWARRALAATDRIGDHGLQRAQALHNLGTALFRQGERYPEADRHLTEAIELAERASAPTLLVVEMLHDRANVQQKRARYQDALASYERALRLARAELGEAHPRMRSLRLDFSDFLIQTAEHESSAGDPGMLARAHAYLEQERALRAELHGPESPQVAKAHVLLANHEIQRQAFQSAEHHLQRALSIYERARGPSHADVAEPLMVLGAALFHQGRYDEALRHWQRERDIRLADAGAQPETLGVTEANIGEALLRLGRHGEALQAFDRARGQFEQATEIHPAHLALLNKARGQAFLGLGRPYEAVAYLEAALPLYRVHTIDRLELADTLWSLARALRTSDRQTSPRARAMAEEARAIYAAAKQSRAQAAEIDAWLRP
jgi:tetratricopeptide (TPR) repeat protein/tRNA A-37 threonylcarbamoyl transferase component Bud32